MLVARATSAVAASKTRMNSRPMILRFCSGSVTPASAARNRSAASTVCRSTPVAATKSRSTCWRSPARSSPWSTNTQVSRSPMARCTSAAATAESTPPDSPQIARPSPTWARTASTVSSMIDDVVQLCGIPAMSCRNRRSTSCPCGECPTSGWYCTPASRRSGVLERGHRGPLRGRGHGEPVGRAHHRVAVAHPHRVPGRQPVVQGAGGGAHGQLGAAVLAGAVRGHLAAQRPRHGLEAVAEPEHRDARGEQRRVDPGAPGSYTLAGPPDRISAAGLRATISSTGVSPGMISE